MMSLFWNTPFYLFTKKKVKVKSNLTFYLQQTMKSSFLLVKNFFKIFILNEISLNKKKCKETFFFQKLSSRFTFSFQTFCQKKNKQQTFANILHPSLLNKIISCVNSKLNPFLFSSNFVHTSFIMENMI